MIANPGFVMSTGQALHSTFINRVLVLIIVFHPIAIESIKLTVSGAQYPLATFDIKLRNPNALDLKIIEEPLQWRNVSFPGDAEVANQDQSFFPVGVGHYQPDPETLISVGGIIPQEQFSTSL